MQRLRDVIKSQAGALDRTMGQPRFGIVTSFNQLNYTARVTLQPEGTISGWLPVLSPWTGGGWGMVCPLAAGDQVLVIPQEGNAEHGVIVGRSYSNLSAPPQPPSGEMWIVHSSGASIQLKANGTVAIAGDLHVAGDVYDSHGSLSHLRGIYNTHVHNTLAGGTTSAPNIMD